LPKIGAIVKTQDGQGEVCGIETLKERVKVKLKDGDGFFYKRYDVKDIKIIKNIERKPRYEDNWEEMKE